MIRVMLIQVLMGAVSFGLAYGIFRLSHDVILTVLVFGAYWLGAISKRYF